METIRSSRFVPKSNLFLTNLSLRQNKVNNKIRHRRVKILNEKNFSTANNPYPKGKFRFTNDKWNKLINEKFETMEEPHNMVDSYSYSDNQEENNQNDKQDNIEPTPIIKPLAMDLVGPKAIQKFYECYKGLNKINSPGNKTEPPSPLRYLKEIETSRRIPQPMGLAKWIGDPNELNLK